MRVTASYAAMLSALLLAGCGGAATLVAPPASPPSCPYDTTATNQQKDGNTAFVCVDELGRLHGPYLEIHEGGNVKTAGQYEHGARSGVWSSWWPNGTRSTVVAFEDDKLSGSASGWYESGVMSHRGNHVEDERDGTWQEWHQNGSLAYQGEYSGGLPRLEAWWHENGQMMMRVEYEGGARNGMLESWYESGARQSTCVMKQDRAEHCSRWTETGDPIAPKQGSGQPDASPTEVPPASSRP